MPTCECRDTSCPYCHGQCQNKPEFTLFRVDMEDRTGTLMCDDCAKDAADTGLYRSEPIPQPEPVKEKSPYQERTITIIKAEGFDDYMAEHHGRTAFQNAIGYLAEWNMWANRFDSVRITCQLGRNGDQPEIGASYTRSDLKIIGNGIRTSMVVDAYFICAIFHPQTDTQLARFTFHS